MEYLTDEDYEIAAKNGISDYKGTASQNTSLLDKLKKGILIK